MPNGPKNNMKDQKNYSKWSKKAAEKKERKKLKNVVFDRHPPTKTIFFFNLSLAAFIKWMIYCVLIPLGIATIMNFQQN